MALQKDSPYAQSRAALRQIYGSRSIDASAPQSARDSTPSGRRAFLEQSGRTPVEAEREATAEFKDNFQPRLFTNPVPDPVVMNPVQRQPFEGGLASPEDISMVRQQGGTGTFQTPFGSVSLLPPSPPPEVMAEFLPATTSPLNNFALPRPRPYLGGILQAASKWAQPI